MSGPESLDPSGRVVMISGAARGIGRAIALDLYAKGYSLSLGVRSPNEAKRRFPESDPAHVLFHPFDAMRPETAPSWVDATMACYGRIDALINNAGIWRALDFNTEDESALDEVWAVNVKAPFRLIRCALPYLRLSGHGRIINIGSTDGKRYRDASVSIAYAMSKHAMMALTHAARFAGWDDGIRVTALCPGGVETELLAGIPGVVSSGNRLSPETIATIAALLLSLPNTASIAELVVNTRLEPTL